MEFGKLGRPVSAGDVMDLVREDLCLVEQAIHLESIAAVGSVSSIGNYLNASGGKRLRPTLVLLAARMVGGASDAAVRMATVVEMIHTATLVHDDIIDEAETRRGRPSTNVVWGNHTSVLAGDWLYMQAFQIALRERNFAVLDLLIQLTQRMVEGELLQLERIGRLDVSEAEYMELVDRKTACLFSSCARLGAMAGGADAESERRLGEFAWDLGIAFQLIDDVLDFTSNEAVLGKPVGSDLREGKVTLPLIYALGNADEVEREMVSTVLRDRHYERVAFQEIRGVVEARCGITRARAQAEHFTEKARSIIAEFPDGPYQRALAAVTELVTEREY